jgi:hypothetical protein
VYQFFAFLIVSLKKCSDWVPVVPEQLFRFGLVGPVRSGQKVYSGQSWTVGA